MKRDNGEGMCFGLKVVASWVFGGKGKLLEVSLFGYFFEMCRSICVFVEIGIVQVDDTVEFFETC